MFRPFEVKTTNREFICSRRSMTPPFNPGKGSNISAAYNPRLQETLINGVLRGWKQLDPRGKSALCNVQMWKVFFDVATASTLPSLQGILCLQKYSHLKDSEMLEHRSEVKRAVRTGALQGWIRNIGDDFELPHRWS